MTDIRRAADVDAAWLTAQLRAAGVLRGASVASVARENIGNGLVGSSVRFALTYDREAAAAPASVVGKFPSDDPTSREAAGFMRLYLRESAFYREVAPLVRIRTPLVLVNWFDPVTQDFVLLFEDLAPARGGDQVRGCDPADAAVALREIAGLHAPLWGAAWAATVNWLDLPAAASERIVRMVAPVADLFRERFDSVLEPDIMAAVLRLKPLAHALMFYQPPARTVLHGDFRLDNVLFEAKGGAWPMATVDWQTIGRGCGTQDVAYFVGAGLRGDERAVHERELVHLYHDALVSHGVRDYRWDACWQDYRRHSVNGLFMAMFSAISVARTPRGDEMFLAMTRRHARQALELDAFALWD
jgi:hypothetical protein